ncbi:hypothetical protein BST81_01325 [Leptolyngbya sp. 'hensonii']|uniref:hypothetical protein n=1 Tax=Leptolyngbya sp. 'hensonii' TaxID=1922337 RepID=UPI00094F53BB|nr:hypothetical protein [Leptolyngbya sp. 'hensonii']OLP20397.1 hypothetical protein BST81_01325 [Leptolyngbya sp. 'hensonii']
MNNLEQIEAELTTLRQRLTQSTGVLENLTTVQIEFENLLHAYHKLTEYIDQAKQTLQDLERSQVDCEQRFTALTRSAERQQEQFREEALKREQTLKADLARQIEALKEESERKRSDFLRDWDSHRESVRNQLDELGVRLRVELKTLTNQLNEVKPDDEYLVKLERVETAARKSKAAMLELDQRLDSMRNWMIGAITLGFLSFSLGLWPLLRLISR